MNRYRWATPGDVNAFFGLALDNVANLVLVVGLLSTGFQFPAKFALRYMVPGTALGVLVGDLLFTVMAFRLARRTGRNDITAMPLGLDTPSTIGMVLFVIGPAFLAAKGRGVSEIDAARHAWQVSMAALVASGVLKLVLSLASGWLRRLIPRAGLLGSLSSVALVLIAFIPLLEIMHSPVAGIVALAIVLAALTSHLRLPLGIPGALAAIVVGFALHLVTLEGESLRTALGHLVPTADAFSQSFPRPTLGWLAAFGDSLRYLPVVVPFALATVIGGIDCTESAAAGGDEYDTRAVIAVEGLATLVAGFCGGVIQTTPYIGHPAYKAMGARAAYVLATAIVIGLAGMFGAFDYLYHVLPRAAVFPILVFVGLEITAQSFGATPRRHYPAVALACLPALAYLVLIYVSPLVAAPEAWNRLPPTQQHEIDAMRILAGGFIITSLLWSAMLASLIDRRLGAAALYLLVAALASLFGVIHSPLPGNPMFLAWSMPPGLTAWQYSVPWRLATGYALAALVFAAWGWWGRGQQ